MNNDEENNNSDDVQPDTISRDDIDLEVSYDEESKAVLVLFTGFKDEEDAEEYAEFLANTLPLLLFETTRIH